MSDCLVTKLKGVVNDDSIGYMGDLHIPFAEVYPTEGKTGFTIATENGFTLLVRGEGNIVDSSGSILGKRYEYPSGSQTVNIAGVVSEVVIQAGYSVTSVTNGSGAPRCAGYISTKELSKYRKLTAFTFRGSYAIRMRGNLSYFSSLKNLINVAFQDANDVSGTLNDFYPSKDTLWRISVVNTPNVSGNISDLVDFKALSVLQLTYTTNFSGDLSLLPAATSRVFLDTRCPYTWEGTRPSSSSILVLQGANLGTYVDAALINLANCKDWEPSDVAKNITMVGTRTSASDAAVARLQGMGWTVTVTEA